MKLTAQQIIDYISDFIGDDNMADYPPEERIRDLNLINQKYLTKSLFLKGGVEAIKQGSDIYYEVTKPQGVNCVLSLTREEPIAFIEYKKSDSNDWVRIIEKEKEDLKYPLNEYADFDGDPEFFIRAGNQITLYPCIDDELTLRIYQNDIQEYFDTTNLSKTSILDSAVHDILLWDTLRYYHAKRDMKVPKELEENFLESYGVFKKIYAPKRKFQITFNYRRPI